MEEDLDLALAKRWHVSPYEVNHVWPLELRWRARTYMEHEALRAEKIMRKNKRKSRATKG